MSNGTLSSRIGSINDLFALQALAGARPKPPAVIVHGRGFKIDCATAADAPKALDELDRMAERKRHLACVESGLDPRPVSKLRREVATLK